MSLGIGALGASSIHRRLATRGAVTVRLDLRVALRHTRAMRRDKKIAKKKKARESARRESREKAAAKTPAALLRAARTAPFGPAYISANWRDEELPPNLVSVVVTRALPGNLFIPYLCLVDRTCLGVKDAFAGEAMSAEELPDFIDRVGAAHPTGMEDVGVASAQSVIFHALDYAAALGFAPHRDFEVEMVGARPDTLEETAFARRTRPFYVPGPSDDVMRILTTLHAAVGPEGFDVAAPTEARADDADDADSADDDLPDPELSAG